MKRSSAPIILAALLAFSPPPAPAGATPQDETAQAGAVAADDLGLYFDQAELTMVESATHAPKPITQVAENISVITAQEIERWNAHSLQEVLVHVPGVLVSFNGREVTNNATLQIQGSDYEHVQVFIDGIRWNEVSADFNLTNQIPVEIIDRVEVIKGPASSTWGSAFGGVVNIITKGAGTTPTPTGAATAFLGERKTWGASTQVAGQAGPVGYFLHGGSLNSDGLKEDRWLDHESFYAKLRAPLSAKTTLNLALSYSNPNDQLLHWTTNDFGATWNEKVRYLTASLDRPLAQDFHLLLSGSLLARHYDDYRYTLSSQLPGWDYQQDSTSRSGAARVYGDLGRHSLSLGAETYRNAYDEYENVWVGHWGYRIPEETWAAYANDTIHLGRFTVTPGLRYDSISIADSQLSPSLGLTWRLNDENLLRAVAARGFRRPVPMLKNPNPDFFSVGNPLLESETVVSYQLGAETTSVPFLRLKTTLFRHDAEDTWHMANSGAWVNSDGSVRQGIEVELETERWRGLQLSANHTFVSTNPETDPDPGDTSFTNLIFDYQGPWELNGRLAANHVWFNDLDSSPNHQDSATIWDATATKKLGVGNRCTLDLFASAHNLFNGSQTWDILNPIYDRWFEAGVRVHF